MDFLTHARLWAHLLWIGWCLTVIFLAYASRGRRIRITHVPIGIGALLLLLLWFGGLFLSVRGAKLLPRGQIIPTLAALEMGAVVLAWAWLVLCGNRNYRIEFKRNGSTSLLVVVWLTVLFLG